ncbi:hypothetical protein A9P82_12525 [Arachidicoccus ginsenosidimutans]|uniref:alpha-2-macroglobulin family protein n=1 Tax=Arachidicoccus sp. BS20 TaxID=1850526 RepID=UPI0007F07AA9|nr:alpha-2-macroglobulin family protein [Arachidicoccus sp. BS20]ANI90034.1 hypothetical protein A9P82_12525 [Arachidicoccus sp. BS20]
MKNIISVVAFIICTVQVQSQSRFQKEWKIVDSLLSKQSQPKTALDEVNKIYNNAARLNIADEKIKAIIYRLNIEQTIKDNDINANIAVVENQITQSNNSVEKSLLQTMEAQLLINYLNQNRWQILNRKETVNYIKTDIATWSAEDFAVKIHQLFENALNNDKLKTTPNKDYSAIVIKGNVTKLRPTLYDLVAHFALDYYKTNPSTNTKPIEEFQLNQTEALSDAQTFIHYPFATKDTLSAQYQTVQLFQDILQFHINDENKAAFVDADEERIDWCYNNLINENKDNLYLTVLKNILSIYPNLPEAKQAAYLQAQYYSNNASGYNAYGDTTHRYDYAKAMEIISQNIDTKDTSEGLINLLQLKNSITQKSLNIQIESINSPNLPMRTLFNYKNVSKVYLRVLKISRNTNLNLGDSAYWATLIRYKNIVAKSQQQLPSNDDYQRHSAELKIDALPAGSYILLASDSENFSTKSKLSSVNFDVSALSYISNGNDYFVLNRETGKPIDNAKVNFTIEKNKKYRIYKTVTTNGEGYFKKPEPNNDDKRYNDGYILKNNDTLDFSANYSYNYSRNNDDDDDESPAEYEEDKAQIYFYTDRAIYRPGQKIYYKGIALTKDKTTHNDKLWQTKDSLHIYLKDVNNKIVDSAVRFVNDYSSFAGTFNIPQNVLTGNFSIDADDVNGRTNFRVEEYKRPTFYADFDTVKSQYKLNDSITVTGFAKAYAGNNVDGAQVKVNVERTARFPYPWLYGRIYPYSSSKEIFNDTVTTDENGKFTIRFKASPDSSVDKKTEPIFNYNISVEVTDNNGETREAQKNISVGYKNMVINIGNAELLNIDTLKKIYVSTQNLEGEEIPANVTVKISPLQSPQRLIRKRFWSRPDQFVMDKKTYLKDFPYDEYDNETDQTSWQKSDVIYNHTMNDSLQNGFDIQNNHLQNGWYYVEATAKDKEGNEVKDVKYIRVVDYTMAQNEYLFGNNKTPYVETGKTDSITIGTGAKDVYVIQSFVKNDFKGNPTTTYSNFNIDAAQKLITYTTSESDKYGAAYGFAFVKNNRFYSDITGIYPVTMNNSLNINYATFRDKTEPGAKEKFIINVKNNDSSNANAELLSAMYDGSLDALYKQNWNLPYFGVNNYMRNNWSGGNTFRSNYGKINYSFRDNRYINKVYDELIFGNVYGGNLISHANLRRYIAESEKPYIYNRLNVQDAPIQSLLNGKAAGISINGNESLNDVVVVGYGVQRKQALTGATQNIQIRGTNSVTNNNPIYVVDGVVVNDINNISPDDITSTTVLKGDQATALYGSQAANGVVIIITKNGAQQTANVQPRTNFNETAFFYPQLHADKDGNYNIEFTMPDAVTSWRWMNLAYDKNLSFGYSEKNILSQKTLMVQPNVPRFLRAGDSIYLSAKISNLSDKTLSGNATIELINPMNNETITSWNVNSNAAFSVAANQSASVLFPIHIPEDYTEPLSIIIKASAGNYSDGEQHEVAVLSNRMLVTESLPLFMKGDGTKNFSFDKLKNNESNTLQNNSVTVEYTSNPVWYAVQSLPYLIQYPYECAEQTFNKFYANALGMYIVKSNPAIQSTFNQWLKDTTALQSNLEKNQELKTLLLNETPWVAAAESEATQKRNVANLFDAEKMNGQLTSLLNKLKELQLSSGGFAWFKGGYENRYITQYIITGIGKLMQLNSLPKNYLSQLSNISDKALTYLRSAIDKDYSDLVKNKIDLSKDNLSSIQMQYLLAKSYFDNGNNLSKAENYFYQQEKKYWTNQSNYFKSMIALTTYRHGDKIFAINEPVKSVLENAVEDSAKGMYWKDNRAGYFWYQAPIEQQSLMIDALNEIATKENNNELKDAVADMQQWLIINKQTNSWKTTKATADACYALLNANKNLNIDKRNVAIQLGNKTIQPDKTETGTGYFKEVIKGSDVKNDMGNITVKVSSPDKNITSPSYGSVYWQYFEDMDKITTAATNLSIHKKLFIEKNTDEGKKLFAVNDGDAVNIGDKLVCRIEIKTDRDMEFVHLKDMRASSMEPDNVLSSFKWQDGLGYYESTKDASTDFFFDMLRKGTYVFDYPVHITHSGRFSSGVATIECMYAPEFSSHSKGFIIRVNEK